MNRFFKIQHKETKNEFTFLDTILSFFWVEDGRVFTQDEINSVLNTLEEEKINTKNFQVVCVD